MTLCARHLAGRGRVATCLLPLRPLHHLERQAGLEPEWPYGRTAVVVIRQRDLVLLATVVLGRSALARVRPRVPEAAIVPGESGSSSAPWLWPGCSRSPVRPRPNSGCARVTDDSSCTMAPASERSPEASSTSPRAKEAQSRDTGRPECAWSLSLGFRRRRATRTTATASTRSGRASGRPRPQLSAGGPAGTMIEPDCHHDHASSVQ